MDQPQTVTVGITKEKEKNRKEALVILWNKDHYITEDPFLVATKRNVIPQKKAAGDEAISHSVAILETTLPIYYRADRNRIRDYAYNFNNIPDTLLAIGKAEATAYFASADFDSAISDGRENACNDLKERIQSQCDAMNMGIEIISVNMMDAHPPIGKEGDPKKDIPATNVAEAYQDYVIAKEEVKAMKSAASSDATKIAAEGWTAALKIDSSAQIYKDRVIHLANAEKDLFAEQLKAFRAAPEMFKLRLYLDFIVNDCKDKRKFILSKSLTSRIYELNFEEKAKLNLLEEEDGTATEK